MNKPTPRRRGVTLIEILTVLVIVTILVVTLTLVLGPRAKRSAYESRIRSDLHQVVAAINLYMTDYDGQYPPYMRNVERAGITFPKGIPELAHTPHGLGDPEYYLTYNLGIRRVEERRVLTERFDSGRHAIVKATFYPRAGDIKQQVYYVSPQVGWVEGIASSREYFCLGGFLDGHVSWGPMRDRWEEEACYHIFGVLKEISDEHRRARGGGK